MIKLPIKAGFFIVLMMGFIACEDKNDFNPSPEIKVIKPEQGISLSVLDTVAVKARLSDEDTLRKVSLNLLDEKKRPVSGAKIFKPDSTHYTLRYDYPINDTLLETGTYYIQVSAYDGEREFARNVKAHIQGVEKRVQGFIVVRSEDKELVLERYNANFKRIKQQSFYSDYYTSQFHSPRKLLFLSGRKNTALKAIRMENIMPQWEKRFPADRDYHFRDNMLLNGERIFASYYSEQESAVYNFSGNRMKDIQLEGNYFPGKMALSEGYIFLERINYGFSDRKLGVYYRETAAPIESYQIPAKEVFDMIALNSDSLFMAVQMDDAYKLVLFNKENKIFSSVKPLESKPKQLLGRYEDSFLISTAEHIYNYHLRDDYLDILYTGQNDLIRYDKTKDRIYILTGAQIEVIDAALGLSVNSFPLQKEITDFHLFYNR